MENTEKADILERKLEKGRLRVRLITALVAVAFLALGIGCAVAREATREVILHDEFISWEEVHYNDAWAIGIVPGFLVAFMAGLLLLMDILLCRYETVEKGGNYITAYRALMKNVVFVNGEERGRIGFFSFSPVIETKLPTGVKVGVTFGRSPLLLAHIFFSDNQPSIDL